MRQSEMARKLGEAADVLCDNNDKIEQLNTALEEWRDLARNQNLMLEQYRRKLEQSIADVGRWQNYAASFWIIADPEKRGGVLQTLNEIDHYTASEETNNG